MSQWILLAASALLAFASAGFTLYATRRPAIVREVNEALEKQRDAYRQELDACQRDRMALRNSLQLVVGALLSVLPMSKRLELLEHVDESIRPPAGEG
jgi:hypothetical protein